MKIHSFILFIVLALPGIPTDALADVVLDWNSALNAIRSAKTSPPMASRNLAILHTALFDVVNGMNWKSKKRFHPYLVTQTGPKHGSREAAASAAAHYVLTRLWPEQSDRFDGKYEALPAAAGKCRATREGIAYGEYVAARILGSRANDGSDWIVPYSVPPEPGIWRPHESFGGVVLPALLPSWGMVTPFMIESVQEFRPPPPPSLDSWQYADEVNMIRALGGIHSTARTDEESEIAFFTLCRGICRVWKRAGMWECTS